MIYPPISERLTEGLHRLELLLSDIAGGREPAELVLEIPERDLFQALQFRLLKEIPLTDDVSKRWVDIMQNEFWFNGWKIRWRKP